MEEKNFLRLRPQSFSSSRTPRFSDLCVRRRSVVAMPPPAASPRSYDLEDRGHVLASAPWSCVRLRQPCFSFPFLASFLRPSRPSVCVEPRAVLSLRGRSFTGPVVSLALACYVRLPSLVSLCSSSPAVGGRDAGYAVVRALLVVKWPGRARRYQQANSTREPF